MGDRDTSTAIHTIEVITVVRNQGEYLICIGDCFVGYDEAEYEDNCGSEEASLRLFMNVPFRNKSVDVAKRKGAYWTKFNFGEDEMKKSLPLGLRNL